MSSNLEDAQAGRVRYYGMLCGVVTDNRDPRGLHRVRANVPGICEPDSDWLWPLTAGGGSPQRGGHVVPAVGSDVAVWFHMGDVHGRGAYAGANWGVPSAGSEMPGDVKDAAGESPELVQTLELGGLRFTVDERPGRRSFQILDVDPEDGSVACAFVLDRERRAIEIRAVSLVVIECDGAVVLNGLEVNVAGRRVVPSGAQIG